MRSSAFANLEHGMYAGSTCNLYTFRVSEGCRFNYNLTGIRVEAVNNFQITGADFRVGDTNIVASPDVPASETGLINLNGSGFIVEGNLLQNTMVAIQRYGWIIPMKLLLNPIWFI